jgi:hypothetical protein
LLRLNRQIEERWLFRKNLARPRQGTELAERP